MHSAEVVHAVLGGLGERQTDAASAARTGAHTGAHTACSAPDLIVLSVLDAAQSRHPLLHLLPVVCAQDQASAGGDNLNKQAHTQTGTHTNTGEDGVCATVFPACPTSNAAAALHVHCSQDLKNIHYPTAGVCVCLYARVCTCVCVCLSFKCVKGVVSEQSTALCEVRSHDLQRRVCTSTSCSAVQLPHTHTHVVHNG